jgi:hypothetical protein
MKSIIIKRTKHGWSVRRGLFGHRYWFSGGYEYDTADKILAVYLERYDGRSEAEIANRPLPDGWAHFYPEVP